MCMFDDCIITKRKFRSQGKCQKYDKIGGVHETQWSSYWGTKKWWVTDCTKCGQTY